jgi:hypothetical protein
LPRQTLRRLQLLVRPDTVLRRHRDLIKRRHAHISKPKRRGRPPTVRSIRALVLRLAGENPTTITLTGQRHYILAMIKHATRRIRILGTTAHPTAVWATQAARNLAMDLDDAGVKVRYLIRDRDAKYPALFDRILGDVGIAIVLTGVRMPRMNSIMQTVGADLPPGTPRPHSDLERTPFTSLPAPVRTPLQPAPPPPGDAPGRTTTRGPCTDHRPGRHRPPGRPPQRPARRHHPRIPTCRPTSTDAIFGMHNAVGASGRALLH